MKKLDFNETEKSEGFELNSENKETLSFEEENTEKKLKSEILNTKTQIKRDGNILGAAFLAMTAVVNLLNYAVYLLAFILSFISKEAGDFFFDPAVMQVEQILFAITAFILPFIVVFKFADTRISDLVSFALPKKGTLLPFFLMGIGFCSFANVSVSFAESIFSRTNINYEVPLPQNPEGIFGFLLVLISTVFVPALVEEFVCRGIILGYLKKYGEGFAVIMSALLFGVMHGNFEQTPFAFLVGLVLGYITIKSKTIWIAVLVHGFNNLISVVLSYLPNSLNDYINLGYIIFIILSLLGGIVSLLLLNGKDDDFYRFAKPENEVVTSGKKIVWFLSSASIIIYLIICLITSVQYFF